MDVIIVCHTEFGIYHMVNEGYCNWYEFTLKIINLLGLNAYIKPLKASELKRKAKRPIFSALKNNQLEKLGLKMRTWQEALKDYLIEKC